MAIGLFFLILAILLAVAMPVGGVFGLMAMLPNLLNSSFSYAAGDVARGMFARLKQLDSAGSTAVHGIRYDHGTGWYF
ncbi:MAG: hypothetical protein ACLUD2_03490 [Clostridium sp.]